MALMKATLLLLLTVMAPAFTAAFVVTQPSRFAARTSSTSLNVGPLNKLIKGKEYEQVVSNIMQVKNLTREQAEQEYNEYLDNPNNYALNKGEEYYKGLGYKSFMDGVVGEAEKEGRGEEVRARIEAFKRQSQMKAYSVITVALGLLTYYKLSYDEDPSRFLN